MRGKIFADVNFITQGVTENAKDFLRIIRPFLTCFNKTAFEDFCDLLVLVAISRGNKVIRKLDFKSLFSLCNDLIECFAAQQRGAELFQCVVEFYCELIFFLESLEKTVPSIEKKPRDRDFFIGGSLLYEITAVLKFFLRDTAGEQFWNPVVLAVFCIEIIISCKIPGGFWFLKILQDQVCVRREIKILVSIQNGRKILPSSCCDETDTGSSVFYMIETIIM